MLNMDSFDLNDNDTNGNDRNIYFVAQKEKEAFISTFYGKQTSSEVVGQFMLVDTDASCSDSCDAELNRNMNLSNDISISASTPTTNSWKQKSKTSSLQYNNWSNAETVSWSNADCYDCTVDAAAQVLLLPSSLVLSTPLLLLSPLLLSSLPSLPLLTPTPYFYPPLYFSLNPRLTSTSTLCWASIQTTVVVSVVVAMQSSTGT